MRRDRAVTTFSARTITRARREVITYNGISTASLVITENGTHRTCTLPLPHGRPTCQ